MTVNFSSDQDPAGLHLEYSVNTLGKKKTYINFSVNGGSINKQKIGKSNQDTEMIRFEMKPHHTGIKATAKGNHSS